MAYTNAKDLMTAICDAVREREGSSDLIPHQELPKRILNLSGGGELIGAQSNGFNIPLKDGTIVPAWQGVSDTQLDFSNLIIFTQGKEE